jgi:hypothetical protein
VVHKSRTNLTPQEWRSKDSHSACHLKAGCPTLTTRFVGLFALQDFCVLVRKLNYA